ncbi:serine/arginine-rich splicing factor RS41 isoform X1 [Prunus yedoensis var. nudiflora]|uniref:Serine/arginine-rich splicing factor RS41 isoform X1 n=1 Tax=Prunus yedoensis var. nudiflora TaxID=2094558 RepID=A0A314UCB9_PRUYE|nr:serine/arginine-rich splicing factor RS41 isoform X1 [Prunus yedoensis var. nudiflora]
MISGRCAACKYLRRRCPSDCIFFPYFPPNNPERFASVHRIYGASNVAKMLQDPFQQYPKRCFLVLFITLTRASVRSNHRNITYFPHIARVRGSVAFKSSSVKEKKMRPIFCGNFEYDARQNELERLFGRYGKVDRVDMKSGFAFIYMEDERDAEYAIRGLDRKEFGRKGRRLRVEWTKVANHERGTRRPGASRRSSTNTRPSKTLFVINFDPYHTRTKDLERHFDPYGKIVSVRIRRNFAFVQYESQEDATRALEATNMSKLMDRVISVEYAVRDDDERRDGFSPDRRSRDRSLDRGRDRRRSPSPYKRERGSPDYGRGPSPGPYRRERGSPDYGRGPSPYRRERVSPDYGRGHSPSPYRRERSDHGRVSSRSPRKERVSADRIRDRSRSPYGRERPGADNGHASIRSPYKRDRESPENGAIESPYKRDRGSPENGAIQSPYKRDRSSPENGRGPSSSPYERERVSPEHGHGPSPNSVPEARGDSPNYGGPESPMQERYSSRSPQAEE